MTKVTARAPINIALIKYWGKKDINEVLPYNPSLSLSLDIFETITSLSKQQSKQPTFTINGVQDRKVKERTLHFLKHFNKGEIPTYLKIETINTGPTEAGLASSASGFAALAVAANRFFETNFTFDQLASITKKGSGSAIRSLLGGCVLWETSGKIKQIKWPFDDVIMGIIVINANKKKLGSTKAMQMTVDTAPTYQNWVERATCDAVLIQEAILKKDFSSLGLITEQNALLMHQVIEDTIPKISYLNTESHQVIKAIQDARLNKAFNAYVTMDAGPNVKVMIKKDEQDIFNQFLEYHHFSKALWSNIDLKGAVIINEND
jgi:diphosphomevalonate decarboxylase